MSAPWRLALLLVLACAAGSAWAEEDPGQVAAPSGWAYSVANELMSPYCPGRRLADCPSPQAQSLRMWLVVQEASGRSRDEVLEELYARYGDDIRPAPRAEGFGAAAYLFPAGAFLAGGALVAWQLRRWTRRPGAAAPGPLPPVADAEVDRWLQGDAPR